MRFVNQYTCFHCQQTIVFSSEKTTHHVCSCGQTVIRQEDDSIKAGNFSQEEKPCSILQIGSTGTWQEKSFTVIGRLRLWTDESILYCHTIRFNDGKILHLGEGYGLYFIMEPIVLTQSAIKNISTLGYGDSVGLIDIGESFIAEKKPVVYNTEIAGEVLWPDCKNYFKLYFFGSHEGEKGLAVEWNAKGYWGFKLHYQSFQSFSFTKRSTTPQQKKEFSCVQCRKKIEVKTFPFAQSCACPHCSTLYVYDKIKFERISVKTKNDPKDNIALGTTGKLKGITYECIGYTRKQEKNTYQARWKEYTLFNAEEGFAFLSEYNGHWIYVREAGDSPVMINRQAPGFTYDKESFQLFNRYSYSIIEASGEFPYNIFDSADTDCFEYISPPEMWIAERNNKEGITWFKGQHISQKEMKDSGFVKYLPSKTGIGAIEPTFYVNPFKLVLVSVLAIAIMIMAHFLIANNVKTNREVFNETYFFNDSTNSIVATVPKFHLDKWRSNLELNIYSPVSNSWFELGATLTNVKTGKQYSLEKGVEYYYGYSDGENWTEGSTEEQAYFTSLPAGDYVMELAGTREINTYGMTKNFTVLIKNDVPNDRNLWWCVILAILWPVIQYIRINYNEKSRWADSPFNPYPDNES